ncbi:saxitoxin and tetrodotoxin-binding protein 1-like [Acanthochromis polyacanthus]|uniref:saxitoxin and tetrodotoxin-binding protein 1-like n=1 Tax=Acanthochromis polyacanthus TaxID=80966 RepID=UPI0022346EFA|nr:saxitoxin and tetrodotoxin-binding protein 1-like [Acanthochromis polyacanthus]
MQVLFRAVLLLLLLSAGAADECDMPEKVQPQQMDKIVESHWVLVEAFSDYPQGIDLVRYANSSVVEVETRSDNKTFLLVERNVVGGKCLIFRLNMTIPDPEKSNHTLELVEPGTKEYDGVVSVYDDQGRADFYQSCPDCLLGIYSGIFEGKIGRMLLFYRKEGKHQDADDLKAAAVVHKKMAECLKFDVSTWFTYDGVAEFCVDKKKEA